jgi:hypothetical protein
VRRRGWEMRRHSPRRYGSSVESCERSARAFNNRTIIACRPCIAESLVVRYQPLHPNWLSMTDPTGRTCDDHRARTHHGGNSAVRSGGLATRRCFGVIAVGIAGTLFGRMSPAQATRTLIVEQRIDSSTFGTVRVFGQLTPSARSGGFVVAVWLVNRGADTVTFTYQCHSFVLEFVRDSSDSRESPLQWRPNLTTDPRSGKRLHACASSLFTIQLAPGDTLHRPELRGSSPPADARLAALAPGRYAIFARFHVALGVTQVLFDWVDDVGQRRAGPDPVRMRLGYGVVQ